MAPSQQKLKEKLLQWRYETAVRRSNDGRVAMFGTAWIMSDDVLDHLVTCAVEGRLQTIQDLQREAHGWPADKKRDLAESFMAAIHAASTPPAPGTSNPSPPNAEDSKSRKRRAPVCAVCNMRGHSKNSILCGKRPKWIPGTHTAGDTAESSSMAQESNGAVPSTVKHYRPEVYFEQSRTPAVTSTNTAQNKRVPIPAPSDASSSISPPHAPTEAPTNAAQDTHIPHPAISPLVSQPEPPVLDDRYPRFELLQYCVFPPKAFPTQNYFADPPV